MRILGFAVLALLLGLAVVGSQRWLVSRQATRAAHPRLHGQIEVAGLLHPIGVLRDRRGIPHVSAHDEAEAYFGLGFVHAQDRPQQLLFLRRAAEGRLAQVLGPEALPADREARVLGFTELGARAAESLPRRHRRLLEAYAAGVNAQLARLRSGVAPTPPELGRWQEGLEAWTPADSLAVLKLYAWGLDGALDEILVLQELLREFGGFDARLFFPVGVGIDRLPRPGEGPVVARAGSTTLRHRIGLAGTSAGSTALVVGSGLTKSGHLMLAADLHAAPTAPALFHQAHLSGDDLEVAGAAVPGVPLFWVGFNPDLAWASTHAGVLVTDLFVETLLQADPSRYHDGNGWTSLERRREEIAVRGGEPEQLEVRATRNGPLIDPIVPDAGAALALRWTGAEPGPGVTAFFDVAKADDAESLRRVLGRHREPVVAVAYADETGSGGVQVAGYVPDRALPTGLQPVPARDSGYGWRGRLTVADLPTQPLRDPEGFEVASDGLLGSEEKRRRLEWLWRPGERVARLDDLLLEAGSKGEVSLQDLARLQSDLRSDRAGAVVELALALVEDVAELGAPEREVTALLRDWDRRADRDSRGAALYHVFLGRLVRELFEESLGAERLVRYLSLARVSATDLVYEVLVEAQPGVGPPDPLFHPAVVRAAVRESLRGAHLRLSVELGTNREKWNWGRLHQLRFHRPWDLGRTLAGPFPYGGDSGSVRVADYPILEDFAPNTISSFRFLIDTAALDEALTSLAPGQSEHVGHPHAADDLTRWLAGRPRLLATSALVVEDGAVAQLRLLPIRAP